MDMIIDFPGRARVDAHFGNFTVVTDQPSSAGGRGVAPSPFSYFIASLGTCSGMYVLDFLRQRNLPSENVRIVQRVTINPSTGLLENVEMEIQIPPEVPEKYHRALIHSAGLCKVKEQMEAPPKFNITTRSV
jgi:ribosomal protein S12 methylthiotransferase accessory factor